MAARKKRSSADVDDLLVEMLVDAYGDDEQLTALAEGTGDALDFPVDAHVVGEPLSLLAVDYEGNERRGIIARCRREDGTEYRVSLADVELPPEATGHIHVAADCRWLGVKPAAPKRARGAKAKARKHQANDDDIDLSKLVDLIVLAVKERAARCRLPDSARTVTLRAGSLHRVVPGQIATVEPNKHWRHNGHPYLSGKIASTRIDAAALGLTPLVLNEFGDWDPVNEYWARKASPARTGPSPSSRADPDRCSRWNRRCPEAIRRTSTRTRSSRRTS